MTSSSLTRACERCGAPLNLSRGTHAVEQRGVGTITLFAQGVTQAGVSNAARIVSVRGAPAYSRGVSGDAALCVECAYREIETYAALLGIPEDVPLQSGLVDYRQILRASGDRWAGYRVHYFGVRLGGSPVHADGTTGPMLQLPDPVGGALTHVQLRMLRVSPPSARVYVQSVWHPDHGERVSFHGFEFLRSGTEIEQGARVAQMALKLLRAVSSVGGRSPASDAEKQEWMTQIRDELDRMCVDRMLLRDVALAQRLGIGTSTLHDRLKRCERRFSEEKAEAETRDLRRKRRAGN